MAIRISAIAAMSENRVIGKDNSLPWHISGDLKHFRDTTMGKPVIMGRKSYEGLGKPLPGRTNIVVSRTAQQLPNKAARGFHTMESVAVDMPPQTQIDERPLLSSTIEDAVEKAKNIARHQNADEIFICGGGEIYKQCLPFTDRIYLTLIHKEYDGDTFFPDLNPDEWHEISCEDFDGDPPYSIKVLERI